MKLRLLLLALTALFLSGCADTVGGKSIAEPEVARFHEMLKRRDFEAIYAATGEQFKSQVPKQQALALFAAIDRKLGLLRNTQQVDCHVNTTNLVTTVALVYDSRFESGQAPRHLPFKCRAVSRS